LGSFGNGSPNLGFGSAHQVFDEKPKPTVSMPRGQASSSQSYGTQAIIARPTFQTWKLILETSFAIKEDFTNYDAMRWAVQELKRRRLKWLFKPVTSTTYERLVRSFYENLMYDCSRLDVLSSSIDDRDVKVTLVDIAAELKCHVEPPEAEEPWIVYPSMLTIEDIVVDMYDGQCVNQYRNATSKAKLPHSSSLWTSCFKEMCVPWDTRRRDWTFPHYPYSFHKGYWCSIPEII
jgi:hypothetical protein